MMIHTLPQRIPAEEIFDLSDSAQLFKALGDETRLRILGLLRHGELCVCDIMEVLKLPQSTASRHLAYLRNSSWISGARRGKWMYYRLRENTRNQSVSQGIIEYLSSMPQIREDHLILLRHLETKGEHECN